MKKIDNELIILQTSDIHGYLFNTDYIKDVDQGLISYYKFIKDIKKKFKHVLLLDNGDLIQGSPLTYYLHKNFKKYNPIIDMLNELDYTALTLGNHEFNYGLEYLIQSYNMFNGDILVANIENIEEKLNTKPYKIYNFDGFKVGVIGFITANVPIWEKKENIKDLKFNSVVDCYKKYEKELQDKTDYIICLYHGGFETDFDNLNSKFETTSIENEGIRILKKFNSIDIFLTGHQHLNINKKIKNTLCRQPEANAKTLSFVNINIKNKKVISSETIYAENELQKITKSALQDLKHKLPKNIIKLEEKTQIYLDQVIGHLNKDILIDNIFKARYYSHPLVNLINKVQLDVSKADVSAISLFDSAIGFKKDVTIRNLIANYPFPNTLVVLEITKKDLEKALEVSGSYFNYINNNVTINQKFTTPKKQHFHYDLFDGIEYELNISKPIGCRAKIKNFYNKNINFEKIHIVVNNFRATNYEWYPMYKNAKIIKEINYDMVEILINYISQKKSIKVDETSRFEIIHD